MSRKFQMTLAGIIAAVMVFSGVSAFAEDGGYDAVVDPYTGIRVENNWIQATGQTVVVQDPSQLYVSKQMVRTSQQQGLEDPETGQMICTQGPAYSEWRGAGSEQTIAGRLE